MIQKINWITNAIMLLYIGAIAFLCFHHFKNLGSISPTFLGFETDKVVHFCMFFPFPMLGFTASRIRPRKLWSSILCVLGIFLIGALIAGATEVIQSKLPYRSMDIKDFKADLLSMAISSVIVYIVYAVKITRKHA